MSVPNTRDHLLQIGLRQIRSMGYASTGIKEILDEAKVPKGSFYHYFPSKEAFAGEVLKLYAEEEAERCKNILEDSKAAPLKRLRRYFDELIRIYGPAAPVSGGCMLGNLSLEMADHSDLIQTTLHKSFANWQAAIASVLHEAIERGDIKQSNKAEDLAAFLLNNYEGAILRSKADRSIKPLEVFLHFTFDILLKN
jgi:TetR/AcrR family transcriptional regulator, transcriptional repressor for nem operon